LRQTHKWTVKFHSNGRWDNPLMGWASTADPVSILKMEFTTKEEAIKFCNKQGFHFEVQEPRRKHAQVVI
jgi:NADH dehydrogenase (ubiquinone) Fe-S protein 4